MNGEINTTYAVGEEGVGEDEEGGGSEVIHSFVDTRFQV